MLSYALSLANSFSEEHSRWPIFACAGQDLTDTKGNIINYTKPVFGVTGGSLG